MPEPGEDKSDQKVFIAFRSEDVLGATILRPFEWLTKPAGKELLVYALHAVVSRFEMDMGLV